MGETITVTMSKEQVIEAIRKETKLKTGNWIDNPKNTEGLNKGTCSVCAVGAVLWNANVDSGKITEVAWALMNEGDAMDGFDNDTQIQDVVADSPFCALSRVFESTYELFIAGIPTRECFSETTQNKAIEAAREASIEFVKEYFPPQIKFSYNGKAVWIEK